MRSRTECCLDWPKPCAYHEGFLDGLEEAHISIVESLDIANAIGYREGVRTEQINRAARDRQAMIE